MNNLESSSRFEGVCQRVVALSGWSRLLLVVACTCVCIGAFYFARYEMALFPKGASSLNWQTRLASIPHDTTQNELIKSDQGFAFGFTLGAGSKWATAYLNWDFQGPGDGGSVDLSSFSFIRLRVSCPRIVLLKLEIYTFDPAVTLPSDRRSHRISDTHFQCGRIPRDVNIDLNSFVTVPWWLETNGLKPSDDGYTLDKVYTISLASGPGVPPGEHYEVYADSMMLIGERKWLYVIGFLGCLLLVLVISIWIFDFYLKFQIQKASEQAACNSEQKAITYKAVTLKPRKDRERERILSLINKELTNPSLNIELAEKELGISKSKINRTLKVNFDLTFTAFVNKCRVEEAGRRLLAEDTLTVTQLAGDLGYSHQSYFTRVFKQVYGCSPTEYRDHKRLSDGPV